MNRELALTTSIKLSYVFNTNVLLPFWTFLKGFSIFLVFLEPLPVSFFLFIENYNFFIVVNIDNIDYYNIGRRCQDVVRFPLYSYKSSETKSYQIVVI